MGAAAGFLVCCCKNRSICLQKISTLPEVFSVCVRISTAQLPYLLLRFSVIVFSSRVRYLFRASISFLPGVWFPDRSNERRVWWCQLNDIQLYLSIVWLTQ